MQDPGFMVRHVGHLAGRVATLSISGSVPNGDAATTEVTTSEVFSSHASLLVTRRDVGVRCGECRSFISLTGDMVHVGLEARTGPPNAERQILGYSLDMIC